MSRTFLSNQGPAFVIGVALAAVALTGAAAFSQAAPVSPEGIWLTKDSESIVRIHACAESPSAPKKAQASQPKPAYCGTIVWLKEPLDATGKPKADDLNSDPDKKNRPVIGLDILLGLVAVADHWTGQAYNPEDGKLYDITFKVNTDKTPNDQADLRGCLMQVLCQTETFTRASEVPGGEPTFAVDGKPVKAHAAKKDGALK